MADLGQGPAMPRVDVDFRSARNKDQRTIEELRAALSAAMPTLTECASGGSRRAKRALIMAQEALEQTK